MQWRPIEECPDELKDGRRVLLWTVPYGAEVGTWEEGATYNSREGTDGYWEALYECCEIHDVTKFAVIEAPTEE